MGTAGRRFADGIHDVGQSFKLEVDDQIDSWIEQKIIYIYRTIHNSTCDILQYD